MNILDQINKRLDDLKKESDGVYEKKALILLKSDLINNTKAKKPQSELKIAQAYHKSLLKTADVYAQNGAKAHEEQFKKEAKYIEKLLPKQMSDDEVVKFIDTCFKVHDYEGLKMGEIIGKIKKGLGDSSSNGKLIAQEVKKHLNE